MFCFVLNAAAFLRTKSCLFVFSMVLLCCVQIWFKRRSNQRHLYDPWHNHQRPDCQVFLGQGVQRAGAGGPFSWCRKSCQQNLNRVTCKRPVASSATFVHQYIFFTYAIFSLHFLHTLLFFITGLSFFNPFLLFLSLLYFNCFFHFWG